MFINATVAEESKRRRKHEEAKQNRRSQSFRSSNDGDGARSLNDNSIEDEYDQEDEIAIYNRNDSPFSDIRSMQPVSQSDKSMSLLCDYKDCELEVLLETLRLLHAFRLGRRGKLLLRRSAVFATRSIADLMLTRP